MVRDVRERFYQANLYRWRTVEVDGEYRRERTPMGTVWGLLVEVSTEERATTLSTLGDVSCRFYTRTELSIDDELEINGKVYKVTRVTVSPKPFGGILCCALLSTTE